MMYNMIEVHLDNLITMSYMDIILQPNQVLCMWLENGHIHNVKGGGEENS